MNTTSSGTMSEDSMSAIVIETDAVLATPDGHSDRPAHLDELGVLWLRRYMRLGDISAIEKACKCLEQAVELTEEGHPDRPGRLNNLGNSWSIRFARFGNLTDLNKAIDSQLQAVALTPDSHPDKPGCLSNLGNSWHSRFERLGNLADIDKAIECQSQAVKLTPHGHPGIPAFLENLGRSKRSRFQRVGNSADIDQAIGFQSQAVELIPNGHPDKPGCLNNLGSSWHIRFERLGLLSNLDKAIESQLQAVALTPDGHPDKPLYLNNLGNSWQMQFSRLGNLACIDKAIECLSLAVELTPDNHPDKAARLNNLGVSQRNRFQRLGNLIDLDKAIECVSRAVELAPDNHPRKPSYLNNLGNSWLGRFKQLRRPMDIERAIEYQSQAVALTPDSHPDKPGFLSNLGNSWENRFKQLGNLTDFDKAIKYTSRAVELTPDDYPDKPNYLSSLGKLWKLRFELHGRTEDLEASIKFFQDGAKQFITRPSVQLECARFWASHSHRLGRSPVEAYERAFNLLPRIASLGQTIQERYDSLLSITDLVAEVAAWAVSVKLYDLALECLERGRSVVWSQTLQLRAPLDELAKVNSDLANRLRETSARLDAASSRSRASNICVNPQHNLESQAQQHRQLAELWDELVVQARDLTGFDGFMSPRTPAALKRAATDGPVVVINTHSIRCDALIIIPESDDIVHVPLGGLTSQQLTENCSRVISLVGRQGNGARSVKYFPPPVECQDGLQPLKNLWSSVVGPVLNALAYTSKLPYDELPHVTWCATGALSLLPLHAAGLYDGHSPNAFDLVVSSYTPTLSALLPRGDQAVEQTRGVLAVGQVDSYGQPPLPMTVAELAIVQKHAKPTFYHQLDGASATVKATLDAMEQYSWVHLACHAVQDRDNPSHSAFYLHDGCLTLEEIAKRQFKNKGLAFLSACQTATGDSRLPDEATHLAAGMLTAGYPSVIATMWSIWDDDAPQIVEEVYAELMKDGTMDHKRAAIALHKAVGRMREKVGVESIDRWAAFIHVGV